MRAIPFLLFLFAIHHGHGQDHWASRLGAYSNDAYNAIVTDAAGNSYVTGEFGGGIVTDAGTMASQGSLDIVVAAYDPLGTLLWAKSYGGTGLDRGIDIALGPSGELVVAGTFMATVQFGNETFTSAGGTQDMFLLKMSPVDGALIWARKGGGADGVDQPNSVSIGGDGSIAVTGEFRGTAMFDAGTITSMIDPDTEVHGVDIFVLKYSASGDALWLKHGTAKHGDRGMAVTHDPAGNVYVAGQFSDTIAFDVTHDNAMYSAVFIARFSPGGTEDWFRIFGGGTYNQVSDIVLVQNNRLMLVGDVQGTVIFLDNEPDIFMGVAPRSSFLMEVDLQGEFIRQITWGSDHMLNTRALSIKANEVAVLGRFQCRLTGFSDISGDGTWLATGQHDLYVARFELNDLIYKDAQQFGGQGNKAPGGIAHSATGSAIFCGSFANLLVFPSIAGSFNAMPPVSVNSPPAPAGYCTDPNYNSYSGLRGSVLMDAFIAQGFVEGRQPYDVFERSGAGCDRPQKDIFINLGAAGAVGPDSVSRCLVAGISVRTYTAYQPDTAIKHNAPELSYLWSTGSTATAISVTQTGWYWVTVTSLAGCWQRSDSVHVTLHPSPGIPLISDDLGFNTAAAVTSQIIDCEPLTPTIWVTGVDPAHMVQWTTPGGTSQETSIPAFAAGSYTVQVTTAAGCTASNMVEVTPLPSGPLPPLIAVHPITFPQDLDLNDSLEICENELLQFETEVMLLLNGVELEGLPYGVKMFKRCTGDMSWSQTGPEVLCAIPLGDEGWQQISIEIMLTNSPCGEDTLTFLQEDSIHVTPFTVTYPTVSMIAPEYICPGDTLTATMTCVNCDLVEWSGSAMGTAYTDSASVVGEGDITTTVTYVDANSCTTSVTASSFVSWNPRPLLHVRPTDGIICPDSVALIFSDTEGISYQWYGPLGPMSFNSDSILVNEPGVYHLDMVDTSFCLVTSDPILLSNYATPYLNVLPDNMLCEEGSSATLQVITTSSSTVQWWEPLAGNALQQIVYEPGTYSVSVNACGITTMLSVPIHGNNAEAGLVDPGVLNVCTGSELLLQALPGMAVYYWLPGPVFTQDLVVTGPGVYTLFTHDEHGCTDSLEVVVGSITSIPFELGPDTLICDGETVLFEAPPTHIDPIWNNTFPGTQFTATTAGVVTLSATDVNGCVTTDDVMVNVYEFAVPLEAFSDSICLGEDATLVTNASGAISWFADPSLTQLINTGGSLHLQQPQTDVQYHVVQDDGTCVSLPVLFTLMVDPMPADVTIAGSQVVCVGAVLELFVKGDPQTNFIWSTPWGVETGSAIFVQEAGAEHAGSYSVIPWNGGCAGNTASLQIDPMQPIPVPLGPDTVFCEGEQYHLPLPSGFSDPVWSDGSTGGILIVTGPGVVLVEATDANGCPTQGSVTLEVIACELVIPNVITPNGDGHNDTWTITSGIYHSALVKMFDRWGGLIWEGDVSRNGFNGRHMKNGELLTAGTYFYLLKLVRTGDDVIERKGSLQILH